MAAEGFDAERLCDRLDRMAPARTWPGRRADLVAELMEAHRILPQATEDDFCEGYAGYLADRAREGKRPWRFALVWARDVVDGKNGADARVVRATWRREGRR